jgi:hypothetical protein
LFFFFVMCTVVFWHEFRTLYQVSLLSTCSKHFFGIRWTVSGRNPKRYLRGISYTLSVLSLVNVHLIPRKCKRASYSKKMLTGPCRDVIQRGTRRELIR